MIDCCKARPGLRDGHRPVDIGARTFRSLAAFMVLATSFAATAMAQVAVTDGGQASYSQAIAVPPGISGMQPNLSLSYVQGGINGPLGVGWSLQGISSITRCGASKAIDGNAAPVVFGPADKLCLDAQRLIPTDEGGNPLAAQADDARGLASGYREFRTEKDTYARIRAYGIANGSDANGPAYFKVWTKSGLVYEYGTAPALAADARVLAQGKTAVAVWAVSRMSDATGNYIDFKYNQRDVAWGSGPSAGTTPGHEWNLAEIQYTGNASQPPANKIIFEYEDRPAPAGVAQDRAEAYQNGSKNVSVQRLKAIRSYVNWPGPALGVDPAQNSAPVTPPGTALRVRTVKLGYDNGPITNRSRLVTIIECAGSDESKCLPPTQFTYSTGGNASFTPSAAFNLRAETLFDATGAYGTLTGDFDGNGLTDILRWGNNPADNQLWLNSASGTFSQAAAFNIKDQSLFKSDQCYYSVAADFNADGLTDVLRIMRSLSSSSTSCGTLRHVLYLSNGDGSFRPVDVTGIDFSQSFSTRQDRFNCLIPRSSGYIANCSEPGDTYVGTVQTTGANFHLIDVNADGFLDIVTTVLPGFGQTTNPPTEAASCANIVCTHVYLGSAAGTFTELVNTNLSHRSVYASPPSRSGPNWFRKPYVSDANGDGRLDLLVSTGVWLSRGDGNFDVDPSAPAGLGCEYAIDFNFDGRSDCLGVSNVASAQTLQVGDGTYAPKKTANFNLTAAGQELWGVTGLVQNTGAAVLDAFDGARSAILRWRDDPTQNKLYISNGDGSFREDPSFNLNTADRILQHSNGLTIYELGDFTGLGQLGVLQLRHGASLASGTLNQLFLRSDPTPPDQLIAVTSPTGAVTDVTYQSLPVSTRYASDRTTTRAAVYPKTDTVLPIYVVTTLRTDNGLGTGKLVTEYAYAGLKSTYSGRGLLGFREVRHQSLGPNGENLTVITQYLQDHPYIGVASQSETHRGALFDNGALLSLTNNLYCEQAATDAARAAASVAAPCATTAKVQRPYLAASAEYGWDLSGTALPSVATDNAFNGYGDLTRSIVTTTGSVAGTTQTFRKTSTNVFCEPGSANCPNRTDGDFWILGRLQRASVQQEAPNSVAALTAPTPLALAIVPGGTLTLRASSPGTASGAVTASGSGGVAPYTFTWTRLSGSRIAVAGTQLATFSATLAVADNFVESFRVTLTDGAGATASATLDVAAIGPPNPPVLTMNPTSFAYGSVKDEVAKTNTFTITNTGGPGTFSVGLASGSDTQYALGAGTCPANGATLNAGASCTVNVSFFGSAQCGGTIIVRKGTLTATAGSASASAALTAQNFVYKSTDPPCR